MPSPDAGRAGIVAPAVVLGALLVAGLVLIDMFVDAPNRALATRGLCAAVLAVAALRVRTLVRFGLGPDARGTFADGSAAEPSGDRCRFHQLHDEVRSSAGNRRYFEMVAWPHLLRLAKETGPPLEKPRSRPFGRGPSLAALARVVGAIEARR